MGEFWDFCAVIWGICVVSGLLVVSGITLACLLPPFSDREELVEQLSKLADWCAVFMVACLVVIIWPLSLPYVYWRNFKRKSE